MDKALQAAMKETYINRAFGENLDPTPAAQMPDGLSLIGESTTNYYITTI